MRYTIVIEKAEGNYSAYAPDLPGCVATGASIEEIETQMQEAIAFHLEGLREVTARGRGRQGFFVIPEQFDGFFDNHTQLLEDLAFVFAVATAEN